MLEYSGAQPNATEVEKLKSELDMAIGLCIAQKCIIAKQTGEIKHLSAALNRGGHYHAYNPNKLEK